MCATGDRHGDIQYKRRGGGGALSSTAVSRSFFSLYGRVVLGGQTAPPFVGLAGM
jgi:hypothetical protein